MHIPTNQLPGVQLTQWLTSKIKDDRAKALLDWANEIVIDATRAVFQTYVEALKKEGPFDAKAQDVALGKAIVLSELTEELKAFMAQNYSGLTSWVTNAIEASIYKLKN